MGVGGLHNKDHHMFEFMLGAPICMEAPAYISFGAPKYAYMNLLFPLYNPCVNPLEKVRIILWNLAGNR